MGPDARFHLEKPSLEEQSGPPSFSPLSGWQGRAGQGKAGYQYVVTGSGQQSSLANVPLVLTIAHNFSDLYVA